MTTRIQVFPLPPPAVFGGIRRRTEEDIKEMKDLEKKLGIVTITEVPKCPVPELFAMLKVKVKKR